MLWCRAGRLNGSVGVLLAGPRTAAEPGEVEDGEHDPDDAEHEPDPREHEEQDDSDDEQRDSDSDHEEGIPARVEAKPRAAPLPQR
jgi:hypothetical protein